MGAFFRVVRCADTLCRAWTAASNYSYARNATTFDGAGAITFITWLSQTSRVAQPSSRYPNRFWTAATPLFSYTLRRKDDVAKFGFTGMALARQLRSPPDFNRGGGEDRLRRLGLGRGLPSTDSFSVAVFVV